MFEHLSLEVAANDWKATNIQEAMDKFLSEETLTIDNYFCCNSRHCGDQRVMDKKRPEVSSTPACLLIHLKLFASDEYNEWKLQDKVAGTKLLQVGTEGICPRGHCRA